MDENDVRSGCHRLHQCTPYSRGSFLHEDGHWYMPYSWMRFYDWFYREAYERGTDDKFYWELRPDNSTVKDARLASSMDPPQPMSAEAFETRKALLESKRTRRPAAPAAPAPRPADRRRDPPGAGQHVWTPTCRTWTECAARQRRPRTAGSPG